MSTIRGLLATLMAVAMMWVALPANAAPADTQRTYAKEIAALFDAHNDFRREVGVAPLVLAPGLGALHTQLWADYMASPDRVIVVENRDRIFHNDLAKIAVEGAPRWAENVAASTRDIVVGGMAAYRGSPPHYNTIISPLYNVVAIGVASGSDNWTYTVSNFYGGDLARMESGPTYKTGAAWLAALDAGVDTFTIPPFDVYTTPGRHVSGGRDWYTDCEPYSQTTRCRTEIKSGGKWIFNNLTYLPSKHVLWAKNPLGAYGKRGGTASWVASDGARWRTECDTKLTGRGGCRIWRNKVFNNIVMFSD